MRARSTLSHGVTHIMLDNLAQMEIKIKFGDLKLLKRPIVDKNWTRLESNYANYLKRLAHPTGAPGFGNIKDLAESWLFSPANESS